jgi:hypothetical protein
VDPLAPDVVEVHGDIERLGALLGRAVVAFADARSPSDYGLPCASLTRELAGIGGRPPQARKRRSARTPKRSKSGGNVQAARMPEPQPRSPAPPHAPAPELEPQLAGVLDRVRHGQDTLAELCLGQSDCDELATALTELELLGLLRRGDNGRYLPCTEHLR